MQRSLKSLFFLPLYLIMTSAPVFAFTTLKGDEAKNYLGDTKAHFLSGHYVYGVLNRSHRDSMNGRFSDGVLFVPDGGHILYIKNKDGDRKFAIPEPQGREKDPVTEDAWRQKIDNILSDDNPMPYVFLDDSKKEVAAIFVGKNTEITSRTDEKGRLEISLLVEGARDHLSNRRKRY